MDTDKLDEQTKQPPSPLKTKVKFACMDIAEKHCPYPSINEGISKTLFVA